MICLECSNRTLLSVMLLDLYTSRNLLSYEHFVYEHAEVVRGTAELNKV
jgi:hypothetical protein